MRTPQTNKKTVSGGGLTNQKIINHDVYGRGIQRFCPVNHVLIASYANVKQNAQSAMTAGKLHVFFFGEHFHDFPFLCNVSAQ